MIVLIIFVILILITYSVSTYNIPDKLITEKPAPKVKFNNIVQSRKFSKKTGKILSDQTIYINDINKMNNVEK